MRKTTHRKNASDQVAETAPILNCDDADESSLVRLWFGAYGNTVLYYFGSLESGFEAAVEWADDHAPGLLTTVGIEDYQEAARELGYDWDPSWPDFDDRKFQKVVDKAEADMTMIGHTQLEHGNAVPSWEWGGDDVTDPEEIEIVLGRCKPYFYKLAYEIVTPESAEEGDVADRGWELEESEAMSLEDLVREVNDHSWLEWSSSNPRGKGDWLISESETDYATGAEKTYDLFIERVDGEPLSAEEIKEISSELGVSTFGMMMMPNRAGELAKVELYNLTRGGRTIGNGYYVARYVDGVRHQTLGDFKADERAARAYAAKWNRGQSRNPERFDDRGQGLWTVYFETGSAKDKTIHKWRYLTKAEAKRVATAEAARLRLYVTVVDDSGNEVFQASPGPGMQGNGRRRESTTIFLNAKGQRRSEEFRPGYMDDVAGCDVSIVPGYGVNVYGDRDCVRRLVEFFGSEVEEVGK